MGSSPEPSVNRGAEADGTSRPTPVRKAMDAPREEAPPPERPTVTFQRGEERWIATARGRTSAGFRGDTGAPLLFLSFARAEAPDDPLYETLQVGRSLEALPHHRLVEALDRARPWRPEWEGADLFPGTRRDRPDRGR